MSVRRTRFPRAALAAGALAAAPPQAIPGDWVNKVQPVVAPAQPGAIALPVTLARANSAREGWAQQTPGQRLVYNVSQPQLLPWPSSLPPKAIAPAVLLIPGGGFQFLAMDNEGFDVARRIDKQGVRVFIVKYRTLPLADGFAGFKEAISRSFQKGEPVTADDRPYAVADTQAAIRLVRARGREWHVDPAKVGILGFSAGAITALATAQANAADARPDFVGLVYGPTAAVALPIKPPPLFAAIAGDDRFFKNQDLGLIHGWRTAGSSVEFHLYSGGGHGFASQPHGTTSDAWFDQFALWLNDTGIVAAH